MVWEITVVYLKFKSMWQRTKMIFWRHHKVMGQRKRVSLDNVIDHKLCKYKVRTIQLAEGWIFLKHVALWRRRNTDSTNQLNSYSPGPLPNNNFYTFFSSPWPLSPCKLMSFFYYPELNWIHDEYSKSHQFDLFNQLATVLNTITKSSKNFLNQKYLAKEQKTKSATMLLNNSIRDSF